MKESKQEVAAAAVRFIERLKTDIASSPVMKYIDVRPDGNVTDRLIDAQAVRIGSLLCLLNDLIPTLIATKLHFAEIGELNCADDIGAIIDMIIRETEN